MKLKKQLKYLMFLVAVIMPLSSCVTSEATNTEYVYICTGPKAKVYHASDDCKGLDRCSGEIKKVPKSTVHRRPCKICYD